MQHSFSILGNNDKCIIDQSNKDRQECQNRCTKLEGGVLGAVTECCAVRKEMVQLNMAMRDDLGRCREVVISLQSQVGVLSTKVRELDAKAQEALSSSATSAGRLQGVEYGVATSTPCRPRGERIPPR